MFGIHPQERDFKFPNPPVDGISSISINGNTSSVPSCLVATAWDTSVSSYQLQYGFTVGPSDVKLQSQMKHDAPVLCSDFGSVSINNFYLIEKPVN
jgi:hypothetical protein